MPAEADRAHRDVMMQHLETVQVLVGALADGDFELAKAVTAAHIGFFARRHVVTRQKMESIPAAYHELALAHVQAARDLAAIIPSKDLAQILPRANAVLKTCMACHLTEALARQPGFRVVPFEEVRRLVADLRVPGQRLTDRQLRLLGRQTEADVVIVASIDDSGRLQWHHGRSGGCRSPRPTR